VEAALLATTGAEDAAAFCASGPPSRSGAAIVPTGNSLVLVDIPLRRAARSRGRALMLLALTAMMLTGVVVLAGFAVLALLGQRGSSSAQRDTDGLPGIAVAPVVFAQPWIETPLPIHVTPPGEMRRGYIQIDGLPPLALLSEGHATRPGSWRVPVAKLATLRITSPATEDEKPRLSVALISPDGTVVSEVRPLLAVMLPERIGGPVAAVLAAPAAPATQCSAREGPAHTAEPAPAWIWPGAKLEATGLIRRGDDAMATGRIGAARQTYEYVADELRWFTAALALAASYDPYELSYLAPMVVADADGARQWYERARGLANDRIDFHVRRLGPPPAHRAPEALPPLVDEPAPLWVWYGTVEAKAIVRWGDEALARGYIDAARQIYEYAAVVMRWPTAALSLAATYDPNELKYLGLRAPEARPELARLWYERARDLMNSRIDFHLQRLGVPKERRSPRAEQVVACR
jgi:hypothetical protein